MTPTFALELVQLGQTPEFAPTLTGRAADAPVLAELSPDEAGPGVHGPGLRQPGALGAPSCPPSLGPSATRRGVGPLAASGLVPWLT